MGNRAVITQSTADDAPCIYLHWNGGHESVTAFLTAAKYAELDGYSPDFMDQFAAFLAKHFFDCEIGYTIYREKYCEADTDNWDNGTYLIDSDLNIAARMFTRGRDLPEPEKTNTIVESIAESVREKGL